MMPRTIIVLLFLMPAVVMEHHTLDGVSSAPAYMMLFISIFLCGGLADMHDHLSAVRNECLAKNWPAASATIKSYKFDTEAIPESSNKFIALIQGYYCVDSARFAKEWRRDNGYTSDVWRAAEQEFPIGSTRLVRYNPHNPETSVDNDLVVRAHGWWFWLEFTMTTTYKRAFIAMEVWIYLWCLRNWMTSNQPGLVYSIEEALGLIHHGG